MKTRTFCLKGVGVALFALVLLFVNFGAALPGIASATAATQTSDTVRGGCFGNLPLVDGRVPTFLDDMGQVVDGIGDAKDTLDTIKEGIDAARDVEAISKKLKNQLAAFDKLTAGLGKYMPVVDKIFKGVDLISNVCDVGTLLVDGYTALATGNKDAFADMVNERVRDAVVGMAEEAGSELGEDLGTLGGAILGGPAAPLTGFLGGWLGGMAGDWLAEKIGGWVYDTFIADWIKNNIAGFLFDLLCPENRIVPDSPVPGSDDRKIIGTVTNTHGGTNNIYIPAHTLTNNNIGGTAPITPPLKSGNLKGSTFKWPKPIDW